MDYIVNTIFIEENEQKEYYILIGKNAKGNDNIIKMSHPDSLWFHFSELSGPHIILQNEGNVISKKNIVKVAKILFEYKNVPKNSNVIYTKVKNVKLTNILGRVIPNNIKLIKF